MGWFYGLGFLVLGFSASPDYGFFFGGFPGRVLYWWNFRFEGFRARGLGLWGLGLQGQVGIWGFGGLGC